MRKKLSLPLTVLVLVLLTCAWIALYPLRPGPREHFSIGLLLGSLYGHSTLASGWIALGPGGWRRLPLAFLWLLAFPMAFFVNALIYEGIPDSSIVWLSAGVVILLVQVIAWPIRFGLGMRICKPDINPSADDTAVLSRQFGIRDLMIITTVVAAIIGGGRVALPGLLKWLAATR